MKNNSKENYFVGLDLLRGISGYGVAISHFFAFLYNSEISEYVSFLFVEFFFVLSGFVLFPQILKIYDNKKNLLIFYKRRWLRTLPVYFLSLLIVTIISGSFFTLDFIKYFFLLQNFFPDFLLNDYFPVVWSLSIEEFFYLLFPLIILILNKKDLFKLLIFLVISILFLKIFLSFFFDLDYLRKGTIIRFDAIIVGFIARYFYSNFSLKICFFASFIFIIIYIASRDLVLSNVDVYYVKYFFIIFIQILSIFVLFFFLKIDKYIKAKNLKLFFSLISKQTYSVYLFHMIFIYFLHNLDIILIYKFLIYLFLLFSTSTLIFYYFEKQILEKRPKLL